MGLGDSPAGKDGRLSPEPVLGDSDSCHLLTPIILTRRVLLAIVILAFYSPSYSLCLIPAYSSRLTRYRPRRRSPHRHLTVNIVLAASTGPALPWCSSRRIVQLPAVLSL